LRPIESGKLATNIPKLCPSGLCGFGLIGELGRDVQSVSLAIGAPGEIEIGAMATRGIGVAGASGFAAGAGGGGETALDHGAGEGGELFEEFFPTHY